MEQSELIRKSCAGDATAFEQLVNPHRARIIRHCNDLLHDFSAAEDIAQEAILKAFLKLDTFKEEAAFSTWLWRIAHNLCLNYMRKNKEVSCSEIFAIQPVVDENEELLDECLTKLPPKQREVFELFYLGDLSQKEIALYLGIPHGTVRSRLHYARVFLRELLS